MMEDHRPVDESALGPTESGRFSWPRFCLWLPACGMVGAALAWVAVVGQSYFAPLVIFPLLVGVGAGALAVGLMRLGQVGNRPTILLGTVLAAGLTIVGQHYVGYLKTYHRSRGPVDASQAMPPDAAALADRWKPSFAEFMSAQAARGRPLLGSYVARGWMAWLSWALDGLLTLAAALAMVIPAMRQPYCNRCGSWYGVIRSGRTDVATAGRLAESAELATVDRPTAARYRLLSCHGGCGPTGFDLTWDQSPRGTSSGRAWLDTERRNSITRVLDEAVGEGGQKVAGSK